MIRKLLVAVLFCLASFAARAETVLNLQPTTAVSQQVSAPFYFVGGPPLSAVIQGNFTYGSGGTSVDAWLQTTFDNGNTWTDIAEFHFTTANARFVYNLSALTAVVTEYTPTIGALSANTAKDGLLGQAIRVEYTTVGTYAGSTLNIDVVSFKLVAQ